MMVMLKKQWQASNDVVMMVMIMVRRMAVMEVVGNWRSTCLLVVMVVNASSLEPLGP